MKNNLTIFCFFSIFSVLTSSAGNADSCVTGSCHSSLAKVPSPHQPVAAGECLSCHVQRLAEHPVKGARSFELTAGGAELCLDCHGTGSQGMPLKGIGKQLEEKENLHGPLQKRECIPCHDPHGSDNFRMLKGSYPERLYAPYGEETYGFCLQCHQKYMLRFRETTLYTNFRNGKLNLHFIHVVGTKGRTCRLCHEPHASDGPKLTSKAGISFGNWKVPTRLELTATGGSCAPGCHRPFSYDRETPAVYSQ